MDMSPILIGFFVAAAVGFLGYDIGYRRGRRRALKQNELDRVKHSQSK